MIKIFHKAKSLMVGIHMSKTVLEAKSLLVRNYMRSKTICEAKSLMVASP